MMGYAIFLTIAGAVFFPAALVNYMRHCHQMRSSEPGAKLRALWHGIAGHALLGLSITPVMWVALSYGPVYSIIPALIVLVSPVFVALSMVATFLNNSAAAEKARLAAK